MPSLHSTTPPHHTRTSVLLLRCPSSPLPPGGKLLRSRRRGDARVSGHSADPPLSLRDISPRWRGGRGERSSVTSPPADAGGDEIPASPPGGSCPVGTEGGPPSYRARGPPLPSASPPRGGRGEWSSVTSPPAGAGGEGIGSPLPPLGEAPAEQEKGGRPRIAHGDPPLSLRDISPRWRGGRGKRTPHYHDRTP